jgi:type III restriction enzyme
VANPQPIQPVPRPILCNPYEEPQNHWLYDRDTGVAKQAGTRRPAGYYFKTERVGSSQQGLFADEQFDDLPLVNALREDVRRWRESNYRGVSNVTRDLLRHWAREDRSRRLFFCQREAVETLIYLAEIRFAGKTASLRFAPAVTDGDLAALLRGERPSFKSTGSSGSRDWYPRLVDQPVDAAMLGLRRLGCKMATGSGKTVVMSMIIAWSFCNRALNPASSQFPSAVLICCPNLTVKERLQVLRPENPQNYYAEFDIVPVKHRDLMSRGKVLIENWHSLAPASPHEESGQSHRVVNKGDEDAAAFAERVLRELDGVTRLPIMVLNDEGHHCWRPRAGDEEDGGGSVDDDEAEEAKVWLGGLDRINNCGALGKGVSCIAMCVDLSATPFYLHGSGHPEGSPFPWLISDFGLVDAIESGIVKIPRLPVSDTTGRPDPKYFRLWHTITGQLQPGEWNPGKRKPKAEVVYREAEAALKQLAGQWKEKFDYVREASPGQDKAPPVLIVVCDNTDIADVFYRRISGESTEALVTASEVEDVLGEDDAGEAAPTKKKGTKAKPQVVYGRGEVFPDLLSNTAERQYTVRIDSKLLAEAESVVPGKSKSDAAEALRKVIATVGRAGEPGEHVRCVVSVSMLTEGWDANNVTHILGVRAFGSQLLCEQVVGRGLRRMDYTPDPATGMLTEEYVDVYGIPFSVIPYKGRAADSAAPEDKPKNHVKALEEREPLRIDFPVVEGYVFALRKNLVRCDISKMEPLSLVPNREPTETVVAMKVGYVEGPISAAVMPFPTEKQTRAEFYESNHIGTITFEIARRIIDRLLTASGADGSDKRARVLRLQSRHQLFPQVLKIVTEFIDRKVDLRGCAAEEIGLEQYAGQIVERLADGIEPDDAAGEAPLLPVLNRNKPTGSTADVNFKTVRAVHATQASHVNQVVLDTASWESTAAFHLEELARDGTIQCYARNEGMAFAIPYEHLGVNHAYEPDFIVRLRDGRSLVLEIKGFEDNQTRAKHEAAHKWVRAVNAWGRLGQWAFHVNKEPATLRKEIESLVRNGSL